MSASDPNQTAARDPNPDSVTQVKPADVPADPDVTQVRTSGAPTPGAASSPVPGYEILGTLGRGGMGVVYKATQVGLNRVVALKMLLAGPFADPSQRARFLLEAESVAALEHPHIVTVYAFGEHAGHAYLALEFVPGGTLSEKIRSGGPLAPRAAAELLVKLADAVAHAHSRGVVHRDIKPLNVLLTADGEPRLTDFGLAKVGRADQHLSMTGQVLGTPAYMAPEQAAGKVREVGTAADVYALGAVLYDLLTGNPPFRGDSAAVTLQKVLTEEPARPRVHNPAIPRDIETICLKCLEKDSVNRYPTAQVVADRLRQYLRGEPIPDRPAGVLERGYKWVKRNKVVACASAAVFLALVVGAGVSLGFGLYANEKAEEAERKKKDAEEATGREEVEKLNAIAARNEVQRKTTELKRTLAKAFLGPISATARIDPNTGSSRDTPLTPYEIETFWRLAELRRDEVAGMFFEAAAETPQAREQFQSRAEYALHAGIGLDVARRDAVERLLLAKLQREPATAQSTALALVVSRGDFTSPALLAKAARVLAAALVKQEGYYARETLARALSAVAVRLEPDKGAAILVGALSAATDRLPRRWLAEGLSAVAVRMEPDKGAAILVEALAKETVYDAGALLTEGLSAVAVQMEPDKGAAVLVKALAKDKGFSEPYLLAEGLSLVAARLDRDGADRTCAPAARALAAALAKEKRSRERSGSLLARGLSALALQMEPDGGADLLVEALVEEPDPFARWWLAKGLWSVAARMEPDGADRRCARAADALAVALVKDPRSFARSSLAESLSLVAARMKPDGADRVCAPAARALTEALAAERDSSARTSLAAGLSLVAARMEPNRTAQAADALFAALVRETDLTARQSVAKGWSSVVSRMEPDGANRAAAKLVAALSGEMDSYARQSLGAGLSAVALRMKPDAGAAVLTTAIVNEPNPFARRALAEGLSLVAARLDSAGADRACAPAANALVKALDGERDAYAREALARGLAVVTARMTPGRADRVRAQAANRLVAALSEGKPAERRSLARGLSVVAAQMGPDRTARAADALVAALAEEKYPDAPAWAEDLTLVSARLAPGGAARVADAVLGALTKVTSPSNRQLWAQNLSAVTLGIPLASLERLPVNTLGGFAASHQVLPSLPLLHPHVHSRPLPPQDLVELLKHPFCIAEARRVVLDALQVTYQRRFTDLWDFVEYAEKHQPHLDLLTPPKRPEPKP